MPTQWKQRAGGDHDLGVALGEPVVGDDARLDAAAEQQPREAQRDVRDDLDVDPRVVGHPQPLGVDRRRRATSALTCVVGVDGVEQRLEPAVAARRQRGCARRRSGLARRRIAVAPRSRRAQPSRASTLGRARGVAEHQLALHAARLGPVGLAPRPACHRAAGPTRACRRPGSARACRAGRRAARGVVDRHDAARRGCRGCAASGRRSRCRRSCSSPRSNAKTRECSRKRPRTETTRMFSRDARDARARRQQIPRTLRSTCTPACDARVERLDARAGRRASSSSCAMRACSPRSWAAIVALDLARGSPSRR